MNIEQFNFDRIFRNLVMNDKRFPKNEKNYTNKICEILKKKRLDL